MRSRRLAGVVPLVAALALAGCFNPKLEPGFQCGEDPPGPVCPDGFFCDPETYTCLRDGTPPTPTGIALGPAFPGLAAARLGDGVVVAGWFLNPASEPEFQVHRYGKDGTPTHPVSVQPIFNGVDPTSLKAAGAKDVAVIVGRNLGPPARLMRLWVYANKETVEAADEGLVSAFEVAASQKRACFVRAYPGDQLNSNGIDLLCHDGATPSAPWQNFQDSVRALPSVTAAVTDDPNDDLVVVEVPKIIDVGLSRNELFAYCPQQAVGVSLGRFRPQNGDDDLLRPQARHVANGYGAVVGWNDQDGLTVSDLDQMCFPTTPRSFQGPVTDFAVVGAFPGDEAGVRGMSFRGAPARPKAEDWSGFVDRSILMEPYHEVLLNPRAVTDSRDDFWFLFYASDMGDRQGWIKCASWSSIYDPVSAVAGDNTPVTFDFAVAPRMPGGFFLVTRSNPDDEPASKPLEAILAPFDAQLEAILPASP